MPTDLQRQRLRADLDADSSALTDAEIDDAFARAESQYPDNPFAVEPAARVLAIQQLLASASKRADYSQNASAERRSQVFDHLLRLRAIYVADVSAALASAAHFGGLRRKPQRIEEYPNA